MKKDKWLIALAAGAGAAAVAYSLLPKQHIPEGAVAVQPFDKYRYLGKWYEIARLPNRIEKNIRHVTEDYSLNDDGSIRVVTKGYNIKKNEWIDASGTIKFVGDEDVAMLKVSYFGPFYASYNVLDIDATYNYALVSSNDLEHLWILSRQMSMPDDVRARFLNIAKSIGFETEKLEWV